MLLFYFKSKSFLSESNVSRKVVWDSCWGCHVATIKHFRLMELFGVHEEHLAAGLSMSALHLQPWSLKE